MTEKAAREPIESLERKILHTISTLQKISLTTFDYQTDSVPVLHKRINQLTGHLAEVGRVVQKVDTNIPFNVVEFIEQGGNPDTYTRDATQVLVDKNQKTNGRIKAVSQLHDALLEELRKNYPDLHSEYQQTLDLK
ncbi:Mediator of RNA polymerase II transcription subunit 10 [Chytriomyces hyalinus]|nr:Mediator of RNA polymerase II transcription subunit 10 [Chytriomyces hyalinus]